jgi:uracil phosphoribosyltransferase
MQEIKHKYGPNIHVLDDAFLSTHLAALCEARTKQPVITDLTKIIYTSLLQQALARELATAPTQITTRMSSAHPKEATFTAPLIDRNQAAVTVNLARAGTLPSQICYEALNHLLNPELVRQDHVIASRVTDAQGAVTGTTFTGSKIGGPVNQATVFFPDPMGATGGTIVEALDLYKALPGGAARKFIALHLIITPEYLRNLHNHHSDLVIYAVRLDRGLSSSKVLASIPGEFWDEERGLNEHQYIVPGGGGFGEILNNAYV